MIDAKAQLKSYLTGTLKELEKLADHIRASGDISDQAVYSLLLKELVNEQVETVVHENPSHSAHQNR